VNITLSPSCTCIVLLFAFLPRWAQDVTKSSLSLSLSYTRTRLCVNHPPCIVLSIPAHPHQHVPSFSSPLSLSLLVLAVPRSFPQPAVIPSAHVSLSLSLNIFFWLPRLYATISLSPSLLPLVTPLSSCQYCNIVFCHLCNLLLYPYHRTLCVLPESRDGYQWVENCDRYYALRVIHIWAHEWLLQRFVHLFSQCLYLGRVHSTAPPNDDVIPLTPTLLNDFHNFLLPR